MTAQSSAIKTGGTFFKFLPYYLSKVKYLRSQLIMSIIFGVLSYPLAGAVLIPVCSAVNRYYELADKLSRSTAAMGEDPNKLLSAASREVNQMSYLLLVALVIACLCLVGMFIFTFVTTLRSFRYLNNKTVVDMDYSLPVNHNTRFFGDLAAVFTVSIVPHLISVLIGLLLLNFCQASGVTGSDVPGYLEIFRQAAVTGLFSCIMQIGICLLMLSFCGRMAEACIYPILVNFAIPVIHALAIKLVESGIYGAVLYQGDSDIGSLFAITSTSPLGMIFMTIYSWGTTWQYNSGTVTLSTAPVLRPELGIPALLITLACLAGAYFLIKYRRAERVGMSYVYKGMDLLIPGIVLFAITMPVCSTVLSNVRGQNINTYFPSDNTANIPALIVGTLITTLVIYLIMELISGKNFRQFWRSALKWAATLSASVLVCVLLNYSNGFGAAFYVPSPNNVQSVSMSFHDDRGDYSGSSAVKYYYIFADTSDSELLQFTKKTHTEILDAGTERSSDQCYIYLGYDMKDGSTLQRVYSIDAELYDRLYRQAVTPESWCSMELNGIGRNSDIYSFEGVCEMNDVYYNVPVGNSAIQELVSAVQKDSQVITADFLEGMAGWKGSGISLKFRRLDDDGVHNRSLTVYDWMENTIALLGSWGLDIPGEFDPENYGAAFIVESQYLFSADMLLAYSEGLSEEEFEEATGCSYDDLGWTEDYRYARLITDDPGLQVLTEKCGTVGNSQSCEYYILLAKAGSFEEYNSGKVGCIIFTVPAEYNAQAEKLLTENLVQTQ